MVKKITISLSDELLERIDAEAEALGTSRSFIMQEASARYVAMTTDERAAETRRRSIQSAIAGMREMRTWPALDDRPTLEILREIRATDDSAPLRGRKPRDTEGQE